MMKKALKLIVSSATIGIAIVLSSCQSEYKKTVERELASGKRRDSLFLGLYLGMPRKDFYSACWALNRQKVIVNGSEGTSVSYKLPAEAYPFASQASLMFFPEFEEADSLHRIREMRCYFQYDAWAPWNKDLQAEKLLPDVLKLLEKWYGQSFFEIKDRRTGSTAWASVSGNRRILVDVATPQRVKTIIADLTNKETR